ncbi:PAS domain-containing protein, partial [Tianweitania sp.]|uniref:PAS domain-containing protein n=1 Tax=Tianweitania sp. TaxID=2021634 RepID=UPI0028A03BFE
MDQLYSFIDVVALEPVRGSFAAGEALVIFSRSMEEVIWTNGPGAAALGFHGIEAAIGADNPLPALARRQIAATPGYPQIGQNKAVSIRLNGLLTTRLTQLLISEVTLPDGEQALLVAFPDGLGRSGKGAPLQNAVSGFGTQGQFVAMLDAEGAVLAATPGFEQAGIEQSALVEFAEAADQTSKHVAKCRLRGGSGLFPAGLARVGDDPALYFLIVIGEADPVAPGLGDDQAEPATAAADTVPDVEDIATTAEAVLAPAPPVRFVWRTDAEGCFAALSDPFLYALGIEAETVIGRSFRDVAADLGFDADGEITGLLERRDTWSGRSVLWPLAEGSLRIPVDLAALPIYDRDRRFEGFRGFGVARLGDAVAAREPEEAAIAAAVADVDPSIEDETPVQPEQAGAPVVEAGAPIPSAPDQAISPETADQKIVPLAAHRQALAERVALSTSERSAFREIGHRLKAAETSAEANTDQPAQSLMEKPVAAAPAQAPVDVAEAQASDTAAASQADDLPTPEAGDSSDVAADDEQVLKAPVEGQPAAREAAPAEAHEEPVVLASELEPVLPAYDAADDQDLIARAAIEGGSRGRAVRVDLREQHAEQAVSASSNEEEPEQEANEAPLVTSEAEIEAEAETEKDIEADLAVEAEVEEVEAPQPEAPAFVGIEPLPADAPSALEDETEDQQEPVSEDLGDEAVFTDEASAGDEAGDAFDAFAPPSPGAAEIELVEALPIPLIIHAGDRLDFANREFFALTGYGSLDAIAEAGGLEALFVGAADGEDGCRCQVLRTKDGDEIPVQAHLQSVPWGGGKSLMLTLRRAEIVATPAPEEAPAEPERPSNVTHLP